MAQKIKPQEAALVKSVLEYIRKVADELGKEPDHIAIGLENPIIGEPGEIWLDVYGLDWELLMRTVVDNPPKIIEEGCEHKWVYSHSDSHWFFNGRNSRAYYKADYYYCEKCLEEKTIEKRHDCYDSEKWNLPEWAKAITKKVAGYEG